MTKRTVSDKSKKNLKLFEKGTSGNPKGRKKGSKNFATLLKQLMDIQTLVTDPFSGKKRYMSNREKMLFRLYAISQAKTNTFKDLKAMEMIMDREEGKPIQTQHISGLDGDSINIKQITDKMTDKQATEIYLREIRNPIISQTINEKKSKKRKNENKS